MKIKTFFDNCNKVIDEIIASLAREDGKNPLLIHYEDSNIMFDLFERLESDISIDIQESSRSIKHYLNNLCLELTEQKSPYFQPDFNTFFFLSATPIRFCAEKSCSNEYLLTALTVLKTHLFETIKQLTSAWRIVQENEMTSVTNTICGFNWELFSALIDTKPVFSVDINDHCFSPVTGSISLPHFYEKCIDHDMSVDYHQQLSDSVRALTIAHQESPIVQEQKICKLLKFVIEKQHGAELYQKLKPLVKHFTDPDAKIMIEKLSQILSIYNISESTLQKRPKSTPLSSAQNNKQIISQLLRSVEKKYTPLKMLFDEHMPEALQKNCTSLNYRLAELRNLLRCFSKIRYPYMAQTERVVSDILMQLPHYLEPLEAIISYLTKTPITPMLAKSVAEYLLVIDFSELQDLFSAFAKYNYHQSVITLGELLIDLYDLIWPAFPDKEDIRLPAMIQSYKGILLSAWTGAGLFEKALYWLSYYEKINIQYHSQHMYNFLFHQSEILIARGSIEHRIGNLDVAISLLHKAKISSDEAAINFAKFGCPELLVEFFQNLRTYRRHLCTHYHLYGLEVAKRGQYDQAAQLYEIAEQLISQALFEKAFGQIKTYNKSFRKLKVNFEVFNDEFEAIIVAIRNDKQWNAITKNLSQNSKKTYPQFAREPLLAARDSTTILPHIIRFRCLQDYTLDTMVNLSQPLYEKNVIAFTQFIEELQDKSLRDQLFKLIIKLHIGSALISWKNFGKMNALEVIRSAEYISALLENKQTAIALEVTTEIQDFKNLFEYYLSEAEHKRINERFIKLIEPLHLNNAGDFYYFNCNSDLLYRIHQDLTELYQEVAGYKVWHEKLNKTLPRLLYDIALLQFSIAYESHTQVLLMTNGHTPQSVTRTQMVDEINILKALANEHKYELPVNVKSMQNVIESLKCKNKDHAKVLSNLLQAEKLANKYSNFIHRIDIQLFKIMSISQLPIIKQHADLKRCFNAIVTELSQHSKNPMMDKFRHAIYENIVSICFHSPLDQLLNKDDYNPSQLLVFHGFFAARMKLIQVILENQQSDLYQELLTDCSNDLEEINEIINYQTQPVDAQAIIERLSKQESYRAEIRLARTYQFGFFGLEKSENDAEVHARKATKFADIPQELKARITNKYFLDLFIPQNLGSDEEITPSNEGGYCEN